MTELRHARRVREEWLEKDPEFHDYWERTALARAVANEVIGYRARHHLTQNQLARVLGVSQSAVARLEAGEHNPTWETLNRLAGKLGLYLVVGIAPAGDQPFDVDSHLFPTSPTNVQHAVSSATGTRSFIATAPSAEQR